MSHKFVKRMRYLEGLKRENWGTLRIKASNRSGATARVLTIHDQPLTPYLPIAEAEFILGAINDWLSVSRGIEQARGGKVVEGKSFAQYAHDGETE